VVKVKTIGIEIANLVLNKKSIKSEWEIVLVEPLDNKSFKPKITLMSLGFEFG